MTAPATAAVRFLLGCALGAGVGLWQDFWRPPLGRHRHLADLAVLAGLFWAWLVHSFGICQADLRLGYTAALLAGWGLWHLTLGRLTRPLFSRFWHILGLIFRPVEKFFIFFAKKCKKTICICEKMGYNRME